MPATSLTRSAGSRQHRGNRQADHQKASHHFNAKVARESFLHRNSPKRSPASPVEINIDDAIFESPILEHPRHVFLLLLRSQVHDPSALEGAESNRQKLLETLDLPARRA
jgi:hypothetical protein